LALAYGALPGGVFVGAVANPPAVILAASADSGVDASRVLRSALETFGFRGGGSARVAQGTVQREDALQAVIEALLEGLSGRSSA
jgi:alanyl-tRNA synthetase